MTRRVNGSVAAALTLSGGALLAFPTYGAEITVCSSGCDYTSIQDAVDHAVPGDTIQLGPETFYENVVVDRDLTFLGAGSERTVIDGQGNGRVFENHADLTLKGVTIQNGWVYHHGGGISNEAGARVILFCSYSVRTTTS